MKKFRSIKFVLCAVLVLTAASFGCKRGAKGPGNTPEDQVALDGPGTGLEGTEETLRPTGTPEDASSVLKTVYFDFDNADIRPDQQSTLDGNAEYLKANPEVKIQVEGHCDERGTVEYNFALGDRRAKAVRAYLVERGIDGNRMVSTSKGEEEGAVQGSTEDAFSQNRRALFKFVQ